VLGSLVCVAVLLFPRASTHSAWMHPGVLLSHVRRLEHAARSSARQICSLSKSACNPRVSSSSGVWVRRPSRVQHRLLAMSASAHSPETPPVHVCYASERQRLQFLAALMPEDLLLLGLAPDAGADSVASIQSVQAVRPSPEDPFEPVNISCTPHNMHPNTYALPRVLQVPIQATYGTRASDENHFRV